jgi:hypothetical protein
MAFGGQRTEQTAERRLGLRGDAELAAEVPRSGGRADAGLNLQQDRVSI